MQQVQLDPDATIEIYLSGTDAETMDLTYQIVEPPQHGQLSALQGALVTYTPKPGFEGSDSLSFVANDDQLDSEPVKIQIEVKKEVLVGDVNGDDTVNIFDLVIAAGQFGQTGADLMGDINADQSVNIFDLVMVAGNFGQSTVTAGPQLVEQLQLNTEQKRQIGQAVDQLQALTQPSEQEETVLDLLLAILPQRLPTENRLLANYPNPFNPETWIPFELGQDVKVEISIYQADGRIIRQLDLGYKWAGRYHHQEKAAYWDGRTELGEKASSGLYFYQIQAGTYSQTRSMIILK